MLVDGCWDHPSPLFRAVYADHPCEDRGCDIAVALLEGYESVAAHLLMSATDFTPELEVFIDHLDSLGRDDNGADIALDLLGASLAEAPDWRAWVDYCAVTAVQCPKCSGCTYPTHAVEVLAGELPCPTCGAALFDLGAFLDAYLDCALWASGFDGCTWDEEAEEELREEAVDFLTVEVLSLLTRGGWAPDQAGHDYWLTRNGHGAGFWDRGCQAGDQLTKIAHGFGAIDLYQGDGDLVCSSLT